MGGRLEPQSMAGPEPMPALTTTAAAAAPNPATAATLLPFARRIADHALPKICSAEVFCPHLRANRI